MYIRNAWSVDIERMKRSWLWIIGGSTMIRLFAIFQKLHQVLNLWFVWFNWCSFHLCSLNNDFIGSDGWCFSIWRLLMLVALSNWVSLMSSLTLIQPGKGRFTLAYMSHDYLHGSHTGLPGWIRVNNTFILTFKTLIWCISYVWGFTVVSWSAIFLNPPQQYRKCQTRADEIRNCLDDGLELIY